MDNSTLLLSWVFSQSVSILIYKYFYNYFQLLIPSTIIIDGQKFIVRSFANANSSLTAEQIFLDILKRKVTEKEYI